MSFGSDSLVKDVMGHAGARAVIERHLPGATTHPLLSEVWYLTLAEVAQVREAGISAETLATILAELAQVE